MRRALLFGLGLALLAGSGWADADGIRYTPPQTINTSTGSAFFVNGISLGNTSAAPYANLFGGETTHTPTVGFYISTNSTISTTDRRFATKTPVLGRNDPYTHYYTLTIPADLTPGTTYYLVVWVAYDDAIPEVDESNTAYHIIRIN